MQRQTDTLLVRFVLSGVDALLLAWHRRIPDRTSLVPRDGSRTIRAASVVGLLRNRPLLRVGRLARLLRVT